MQQKDTSDEQTFHLELDRKLILTQDVEESGMAIN